MAAGEIREVHHGESSRPYSNRESKALGQIQALTHLTPFVAQMRRRLLEQGFDESMFAPIETFEYDRPLTKDQAAAEDKYTINQYYKRSDDCITKKIAECKKEKATRRMD